MADARLARARQGYEGYVYVPTRPTIIIENDFPVQVCACCQRPKMVCNQAPCWPRLLVEAAEANDGKAFAFKPVEMEE